MRYTTLRLTAAAPARRLARAAPRRGYPPAPRATSSPAIRLPEIRGLGPGGRARAPARPGRHRGRRPRQPVRARRLRRSRPARQSASGIRRRALRPAHARPSVPPPRRDRRWRDTARRVASSSSRISTATMPWPGAGTQAVAGSVNEIREREPEPAQACRGEDQRVVLAGIELAQPRVEVAADRRESRPGKQPRELRDAADAARADRRRAAKQRDEISSVSTVRLSAGHSSVVSGFSRTGSTTASRGSSRGSTPPMASPSGSTAGMSLLLCTARSISPREQRVLDLLDEQPLAADLGQRRILQPIAGGLDHDDARRRAAAARRSPRRRGSPATARAGCLACRAGARSGRGTMVSSRTASSAARTAPLADLRSPRRVVVFAGSRRLAPALASSPRPNSRVSASE